MGGTAQCPDQRKIAAWIRPIGDKAPRVSWAIGYSRPLPSDERQALTPFLEPVPLRLGQALYEAGGKQAYVYFPTCGIVSLLYVLESGASAEIAVTGNEGVVGISLFMG